MYVAMNRFRVTPGSETAFEELWRNRRSRLDEMEGFVEFNLLRGPSFDSHTLYASHTIWEDEASFRAWTTSPQFREAHRDAGLNKPLYLGHPEFEGFSSIEGV
ncbi:MAG TPA: antibiotic biosynthesis monooxygenase [Amaricoccus sp.]|uniref:antibiotic biosynthesis monooxygenase family protein n=1 Tax=Amaricoccus sp. TaxID=1872485 RepID=UPI002B7933EC|nr:antibiotic biosynthesis monooxygenase [Amaricoccus sp.]HMQ93911.1 antibiotic biosynthesis monooxygenase [Amaricoccus sp.]HMR51845.1 antibiotic biosynthesis monooxygenase [Amaricoccus sp.]HMR60271.1 antibiotic biosynthesis monooxygenase [Amaricoccus sp.]HMU01390.1 antibiotic biosynthesis monooxygenase [Amaricoccus sp.]